MSISDAELDVVESVSGVLIMQDVQRGRLMALLPFFEGGGSSEQGAGDASSQASYWPSSQLYWFLQLFQGLFGLPMLVLLLRSIGTRLIGKFHRYMNHGLLTFHETFDFSRP